MKFAYIMGISLTKFILFSHKVSFIMKPRFLPLGETLYASRLELFAEASEIFTHAVFQHVVDRPTTSSECMLQGPKKMEV